MTEDPGSLEKLDCGGAPQQRIRTRKRSSDDRRDQSELRVPQERSPEVDKVVNASARGKGRAQQDRATAAADRRCSEAITRLAS
jgi:hypothetical protein